MVCVDQRWILLSLVLYFSSWTVSYTQDGEQLEELPVGAFGHADPLKDLVEDRDNLASKLRRLFNETKSTADQTTDPDQRLGVWEKFQDEQQRKYRGLRDGEGRAVYDEIKGDADWEKNKAIEYKKKIEMQLEDLEDKYEEARHKAEDEAPPEAFLTWRDFVDSIQTIPGRRERRWKKIANQELRKARELNQDFEKMKNDFKQAIESDFTYSLEGYIDKWGSNDFANTEIDDRNKRKIEDKLYALKNPNRRTAGIGVGVRGFWLDFESVVAFNGHTITAIDEENQQGFKLAGRANPIMGELNILFYTSALFFKLGLGGGGGVAFGDISFILPLDGLSVGLGYGESLYEVRFSPDSSDQIFDEEAGVRWEHDISGSLTYYILSLSSPDQDGWELNIFSPGTSIVEECYQSEHSFSPRADCSDLVEDVNMIGASLSFRF